MHERLEVGAAVRDRIGRSRQLRHLDRERDRANGTDAAGNCGTRTGSERARDRNKLARNDEGAGAGETRKPAVDEGKASKGNRA